MSTNEQLIKNGIETRAEIFVFRRKEAEEEEMESLRTRSKIWQVFPACIASLLVTPFGLMLGWPSPTYPQLLSDSSPLPITLDQSAMIAGFLMLGNILATPFSSWSVCGTKYGIIISLFLMLMGWVTMWYALDIYYLLVSRFLIGLGCGYGVGQLKIYIKELCVVPTLAPILLKLVNFYIHFGIILAYIIGYFCTFTTFSLIGIGITTVIFIINFLLPHTPKEYLRFNKVKQAKATLKYLKPNLNVEYEMEKLRNSLENKPEVLTFFQVLKDEDLRKRFAIVVLLTFFMQFSGAPPTVIYTQIILTASFCPHPEMLSIVYVCFLFICYFIGMFGFSHFNRKACLLYSSVSVTLTLFINIGILYLDFNQKYWEYTFLVTLFAFAFFHTTGLAVVPFMLTQEYIPEPARKVVSEFQIMEHSLLALIITKSFQVLYDKFGLYVPFCMFSCVSFIAVFFILLFVPFKQSVLDKSIDFKNPTRG